MTRLLWLFVFVGCLTACSFTRSPLPLPPSFQTMESVVEAAPQQTAYFGLHAELNQPEDAFSLDMPPGIRVTGVDEGSPAAEAGLQIGDILLEFNHQATDDPQRLATLLEQIHSPQKVELRIQRGSEVLATEADLVVHSTQRMRSIYHVDRGLLRAAFRDDELGRPQVVELAPASPLAESGVREGDVIVQFQGADPGSSAELVRRARLGLRPGDSIDLVVEGRQGGRRAIQTHAWDPGTALTEVGLWPLFSWSREIGRDRGEFRLGLLVITDLFRYRRDGEERDYSILSLLHWQTGELVLEDGLKPTTSQQP